MLLLFFFSFCTENLNTEKYCARKLPVFMQTLAFELCKGSCINIYLKSLSQKACSLPREEEMKEIEFLLIVELQVCVQGQLEADLF